MKVLKSLLVIPILLIAIIVKAGTREGLNVIGFSKDSKFYAFELFYEADGIGGYFSIIKIVDVDNNRYLKVITNSQQINDISDVKNAVSFDVLRKNNYLKAKQYLNQYKIQNGNKGTLVFQDEYSYNGKNHGPVNKAVIQKGTPKEFTLHLKQWKIKKNTCKSANGYGHPKIFQLTYISSRVKKILQKDRVLFNSRGCPYVYSIENVYLHQKKIIVFLRSWQPGFEGPDERILIVTGKVP